MPGCLSGVGPDMPNDLLSLALHRKDAVVEEIVRGLRQSDSPHYRELDPGELRPRVVRLVEAFLDSSSGDPGAFLYYLEHLVKARIAEGYFLDEMQAVLNLLERQLWDVAVAGSQGDQLVASLTFICRTMGRGRDLLARGYFERAREADTRRGQLESRLRELAASAAHPTDPDEE